MFALFTFSILKIFTLWVFAHSVPLVFVKGVKHPTALYLPIFLFLIFPKSQSVHCFQNYFNDSSESERTKINLYEKQKPRRCGSIIPSTLLPPAKLSFFLFLPFQPNAA